MSRQKTDYNARNDEVRVYSNLVCVKKERNSLHGANQGQNTEATMTATQTVKTNPPQSFLLAQNLSSQKHIGQADIDNRSHLVTLVKVHFLLVWCRYSYTYLDLFSYCVCHVHYGKFGGGGSENLNSH